MENKLIGIVIVYTSVYLTKLPEDFRKFKRHCQCIFNGPLKDEVEDVKVQYLLLWVGPNRADIRYGWALNDTDQNKLNIHWAKYDAYGRPKSSFRVARFKLHALKQYSSETIDAYVTHAKIILSQCQYSDSDEMLLNTIISGVRDESVQSKLISKDDPLTVDKAMDIIRSYESTKVK